MTSAALRLPAFALPLAVRRHGFASLVLAVMAALYLVAALSVTGLGGADGNANAKTLAPRVMTLPELKRMKQQLSANQPQEIKEISPEDAVAYNASIALSALPNPAARAFMLGAGTPFDRARAVDCLTAAVYYEAAIESVDGQRAVAQVVLNRLRHPAFPNTVCGVVFEGWQRVTGCQFTFTCDGAMTRPPVPALWARARTVAEEALAGKVYKPVGLSTHYHTNWVVPYWASSLEKVANVGTHIFYRWSNGWGTPPVFRDRHAGAEPEVAAMRPLSSVPMSAEVPGEQTAAAAAVVDPATGEPVVVGEDGKVQRSYEPLRQQAAARELATQIKGAGDGASTHQWALTGETVGPVEAALGRKLAATPAPERKCKPATASDYGPPSGYGPTC